MKKMTDKADAYEKFAVLYNEILDSLSDANKSKLEDLFCIMQEMKNNEI